MLLRTDCVLRTAKTSGFQDARMRQNYKNQQPSMQILGAPSVVEPDIVHQVLELRDRKPTLFAVNHAVTVRANKGKLVYMGPLSFSESGNRFRMMALDESLAAITVHSSKIKITDFAEQSPVSPHGLLAFALD